MPNRLTRVPDRPVPPLPSLGRALLPLADAVMILLLSRPASGSLRTTWVTPATAALAAAFALLALPLGALVLAGAGGPDMLALAAGLLLLALAAGCISIVLVSFLQHR
jgi:hypothetical protein